jgi:hypothetical protein
MSQSDGSIRLTGCGTGGWPDGGGGGEISGSGVVTTDGGTEGPCTGKSLLDELAPPPEHELKNKMQGIATTKFRIALSN